LFGQQTQHPLAEARRAACPSAWRLPKRMAINFASPAPSSNLGWRRTRFLRTTAPFEAFKDEGLPH
jgi:hypothetical protein